MSVCLSVCLSVFAHVSISSVSLQSFHCPFLWFGDCCALTLWRYIDADNVVRAERTPLSRDRERERERERSARLLGRRGSTSDLHQSASADPASRGTMTPIRAGPMYRAYVITLPFWIIAWRRWEKMIVVKGDPCRGFRDPCSRIFFISDVIRLHVLYCVQPLWLPAMFAISILLLLLLLLLVLLLLCIGQCESDMRRP